MLAKLVFIWLRLTTPRQTYFFTADAQI